MNIHLKNKTKQGTVLTWISDVKQNGVNNLFPVLCLHTVWSLPDQHRWQSCRQGWAGCVTCRWEAVCSYAFDDYTHLPPADRTPEQPPSGSLGVLCLCTPVLWQPSSPPVIYKTIYSSTGMRNKESTEFLKDESAKLYPSSYLKSLPRVLLRETSPFFSLQTIQTSQYKVEKTGWYQSRFTKLATKNESVTTW